MLFYIILAIVVLLALLSLWQHKMPDKAVMDMISGVVEDDPQTLADAAGVDLDTYSLARVAQSEEGVKSDRAKIAVMYATKNHSERTGKSITDIVTRGNPKRSDYDQANGRYGRQGIHPYCSTICAPTAATLVLAQSVMDGSAVDETQGAQWFDNPYAQDALALANPKDEDTGKGYYTSEQIKAKREAKGAKMVTIDGVSTRFWN
jgi:hypothetical protein